MVSEKNTTEFACLELIDKIKYQLDTKTDPFAVFLDFSKAFDTIDHEILLYKLSYYGINEVALCLIKDYLSNRYQYVQIGQTYSSTLKINTGIPQGSILGPHYSSFT